MDRLVLPTRPLGIPAPAATVLLATLLFTQVLPLLGFPGGSPLTQAQWFSVVDLIGARELRFDSGSGDPMEPLNALLAREQRFPLVDPHNSLDGFFAALQRAEAGELQGKIHILHYGDSPTTADLITADVRARLQERFGNAGHGFSLVAPPWAWYQHRGIRLRASGWRMVSPAMGMKGDGKYGLGGVSFEGSPGSYSQITLQDRTHTRLKVYYLNQPNGGTFEIVADGQVVAETSTAAETVHSAARTFPIPSGTQDVLLRVTSGNARVFGLEFSRNSPGVVYSSLGLNGANTTTLSRYMEAGHWGQQLRAAEPQLVVINYGTNESVYGAFVTKYLETELRRLVSLVRESVPNSAILIMSPMDRGSRNDTGEIVTPETIPDIVRIQEKVARDMKVAFFNTFEAMGGAGTMARWYQRNPRLVGADYIHPMPAGAKLVGDLLYQGLEEQYQRYKLKKIQKSLSDSKGKTASLQPERRKTG